MNAVAPKSVLDNATPAILDPNTIDVSGRIGFYFPDKAVAFGKLIAVDGQRDPIKVSAQPEGAEFPWRLHVGLHRTMGARIEEFGIHALIVEGTLAELEQLEASENLHRRTPPPIERAKFTAATVRAAQERIAREHGNLGQQRLAVKARWDRVKAAETTAEQALKDETEDTCAKIAHVYGWEESVGEALGMSRRTIHNDLALYRLLIEPFPELAEPLSKHPVVGENASQLRAVARVKYEHRRAVIEALLADPEMSADAARISVGIDSPAGMKPTPEKKFADAVIGNLGRLNATQQKNHVDSIIGALKTDEVKRQLRDRLNEELGE
tara:strand:- start:299 stop:1273 length:975 start_codon:yes stop_codon:yes gene_type:complete